MYLSSSEKFTVIVLDNSVKIQILDIHSYRIQFNHNSKMIINNMFETNQCHLHASRQTKYLVSLSSVSKVNTNTLINYWPFIDTIGIISFTILALLYLF